MRRSGNTSTGYIHCRFNDGSLPSRYIVGAYEVSKPGAKTVDIDAIICALFRGEWLDVILFHRLLLSHYVEMELFIWLSDCRYQ